MIDILFYLFVTFIVTMFVWSDYLAVMHLKTHMKQGKLTTIAKVFAYPRIGIFLVTDVLFNLTFGTVFFMELPRELLFTSRVSRLNDRTDWRGKVATYFCRKLLDPFDPDGKHCS